MRETLALGSVKVDLNSLSFGHLEEALGVLRPALKLGLPRSQGRSGCGELAQTKIPDRVLILYARLLCLQYENDPKGAYDMLRDQLAEKTPTDVLKAKMFSKQRVGLSTILEQPPWSSFETFKKWHSKTVEYHPKHRVFRMRLASRILDAQEVLVSRPATLERDSSSGQDTLQGEESSNLSSRPPQFRHRRRSWMARVRKKLRQKRKLVVCRFQRAAGRTTTPSSLQ